MENAGTQDDLGKDLMPHPFLLRLGQATNLNAAETAELVNARWMTRQIPAKSYVARTGDDGCVYQIVLTGWAVQYQILRNGARQITRLLLPGDMFCLQPSNASSTSEEVTTVNACTIAQIAQQDLCRAITSFPLLGEAMRRYAAMENAILANWVVNVGRRDAMQRIGHLICEVRHRLAIIEPEVSDTMFFPLTQDDLADMLGLTPVHINRKLQQMRQEGLIALKSRRLTILDRNRLEQIAGFNSDYLGAAPLNYDLLDRRIAA
jgi:CRP-like cAMP-binding protein